MAKNNIDKYLSQYAEPEVAQLCAILPDIAQQHAFDYACVIPAYKESSRFVETLVKSQLQDNSVLLVLVINQPDSDSDLSKQMQLYNQVIAFGEKVSTTEQLTYLSLDNAKSAILIVDKFNFPIDEKQGVGLARKTGCDLALALYQRGLINSRFVGSTDADATLPSDYFDKLGCMNFENSFAVFNFSHVCTDLKVHQANQRYETALRYFVAGLNYAGSDYGHYTIGSLLAINLEHYVIARGFPKRSAGEDFYLLNKLAKIGNWQFFSKSIVRLKARISDRVPFGTGPTVKKILALTETQQDYCYYHPELFEKLKLLLIQFNKVGVENIDSWAARLDDDLYDALQKIGFEKFCLKHRKSSELQFRKQLSVWFDNFKTLKFLHVIRENNPAFQNIPLEQALTLAPFKITDFPAVDA